MLITFWLGGIPAMLAHHRFFGLAVLLPESCYFLLISGVTNLALYKYLVLASEH
jgi:hypothetical protein